MGFREILAKYADTIWMLNDEEQHRLFVALVEYAEDGTLPEEQGNEKYVFSMMRKEMDSEKRKESRSEINRKNVQKRWNKMRESDTNDTKDTNNTNRISYEKEEADDTKTQEICLFDTNDTNCISYKNQTGEKESGPSPLSPSLSSPEPPSNTPPIVPQPTKEKESHTGEKVRHKRGQYGHVLLSDEEFDRLAKDFGENERAFLVKMMDEYAERNGKSYKNWNLAIRNAKRDGWFDRQRVSFKPIPSQQAQDRKEAKLREYDEMTRRTFEALGFDYGSNG